MRLRRRHYPANPPHFENIGVFFPSVERRKESFNHQRTMSSSSKSQDDVKPHPKKEFRCTVCRVTCLSEISYQAHIRGAKHLKAMKSVRSFEGRDCQIPPPKKLTSLKDYINDPDRDEPLIGLKYVEEGKKIKGKRHYRCTLCELDMAMQIMFDHLIGHKHRRSYLNRHFPLLIKGVQAPTVTVIKKLAQEVEEEEGIQTYETNVNIKLKPQVSKKKSSQKSSEQPSQTNPAEPMQTNADEFIENLSNQTAEVAAQPPSFQAARNDYRTSKDGASQYQSTSKQYSSRDSEYQSKRSRDYSPSQNKSYESKKQYSSSRESEHQSKRYKDQSSSQYQPQAVGYAKSAEEYRSSKAYDSGNRQSSTGYSKDYNKSSRTYDSGSSQPGSGYSKDYDRSARTYDSGNQPGSGYSKGYEGSVRNYDSGSQPPSYGYNKDHEPSRTYESAGSHSSSAFNQGFGQSSRTSDSSSHQSSAGYNQDYGTPARTYEPTSHSASGYDQGYDQHQASSAVQPTQQTMPPSGTMAANPGGLSPDILKILQGKDVPTVTSILSRLAQYYPPLQNVDISLLVSVLFESGALK